MSENERQHERGIVSNDESQGNIALRLKYAEIYYKYFIRKFNVISALKEFRKFVNVDEVTGKKADCLWLCAHALSC